MISWSHRSLRSSVILVRHVLEAAEGFAGLGLRQVSSALAEFIACSDILGLSRLLHAMRHYHRRLCVGSSADDARVRTFIHRLRRVADNTSLSNIAHGVTNPVRCNFDHDRNARLVPIDNELFVGTADLLSKLALFG
jgi:hypothetical protein